MPKRQPLLLDLFSGAGGAAVGYHRAGFDVVGVDHAPQPRYPFRFIQADALDFLRDHGEEFDAIHASPPCQAYSRLRHLPWLKDKAYPRLLDPVRALLEATGRPWIIENVEDAPLGRTAGAVLLCGYALGLPIYRHRRFESNILLLAPPHRRHPAVISAGRLLNNRYSRASGGVTGVLPPEFGTTQGVERSFGTLVARSSRTWKAGLPVIVSDAAIPRKSDWSVGTIVASPAGHSAGMTLPHVKEAMGIDWMTRDELSQAIPPAYTELLGRQLWQAMED